MSTDERGGPGEIPPDTAELLPAESVLDVEEHFDVHTASGTGRDTKFSPESSTRDR